MNRLVRGSILLAAVALQWSCGGNPLDANAGSITKVVASPSVVFVTNVDSQAIIVEADNDLGQQNAATFDIANVGPGLTVTRDTAYAPYTSGGHVDFRARFFVKATTTGSLVSSTFEITAGGKSDTVQVTITPASFVGTVSNLTPNVGDTVTLVATAPLTFSAATTVTVGGLQGFITSMSPDFSTLSFLPVPGSVGNLVVSDLQLPYLAGSLSLTADDQVTVGPTLYLGTDAQATAPTIPTPASGQTIGFYDVGSWGGDCGGAPCQWYKLIVTTAGDYDFSSAWDNNSDLGIYVVASNGTTGVGACDAAGDGSGAQPEACTITLAAGTYYVQMQNFAPFYPDPDPAWFFISITLP